MWEGQSSAATAYPGTGMNSRRTECASHIKKN